MNTYLITSNKKISFKRIESANESFPANGLFKVFNRYIKNIQSTCLRVTQQWWPDCGTFELIF